MYLLSLFDQNDIHICWLFALMYIKVLLSESKITKAMVQDQSIITAFRENATFFLQSEDKEAQIDKIIV